MAAFANNSAPKTLTRPVLKTRFAPITPETTALNTERALAARCRADASAWAVTADVSARRSIATTR